MSTGRNTAKEKMRAGETALGMIVRLVRSSEIARIAKATDHDFLFVDAQHALFDLETIAGIASAAIGCGIPTLVRVRGFDDPDMSRLLDAGVMGIVVPDVNDADAARHVVEMCKFAPIGKRSIGGPSPTLNYQAIPTADLVRMLNDDTLVICMIETQEGLANVEAIAGVEGVDVLHVGCNDLLLDMGLPGKFGCPEMMAAVRKVIAVCAASGKIAGLGGDRDLERQKQFAREGVRFITTQPDITFLMTEASRRTKELRSPIAS